MVKIILDCRSQCTSIPEDWRLKEQFNVEWEVEPLFPWQYSCIQDSCKLKHTSRIIHVHVHLSSLYPFLSTNSPHPQYTETERERESKILYALDYVYKCVHVPQQTMSGCDRDERKMESCGLEIWHSRSIRPKPLLIGGCPWQQGGGNGCCLSLEWITH